mmetsp:Transcript_25480/g.73469  ORF Transcript_25480/g.73469 Transcript_25480/m.73469 type:complete len:264 (-) Transcript_25480:690-1481(-)
MRGQRVRANRSSGSETSGSGKSVRRRLGARRRPDRIKDKVDEVEPKKGTRGERVEIKVLVDVAGANDGKAEEAGERDGMQQRVEVEAEATQGAGASDVGEEKMRQLRCGSEQGAQADHVAGDDVGGWAHPHVAERRPSRARVDGPVGPRQEKRCRHLVNRRLCGDRSAAAAAGCSQHPPSQLPFAAQCGQAPFRSKRRAATEWRRRGRRGRGAGPGRRGAGRGCEGSRTRSRGSRPQRTWGRRGSEPQRRTIPAEARPGFGRS